MVLKKYDPILYRSCSAKLFTLFNMSPFCIACKSIQEFNFVICIHIYFVIFSSSTLRLLATTIYCLRYPTITTVTTNALTTTSITAVAATAITPPSILTTVLPLLPPPPPSQFIYYLPCITWYKCGAKPVLSMSDTLLVASKQNSVMLGQWNKYYW